VGVSKKTGARCTAWAVRGKLYCAGHLGLGKLDAARAAARSAEVRQATAAAVRKPLRALLADKLEAHADEIVTRWLAIIQTGENGEALRAIEAMMSRVYGRPTESLELTQPDRSPEQERIAAMTPEERAAVWAAIRARKAALGERPLLDELLDEAAEDELKH
jgi:hypothetical protein